jgi:hypothetical protein
MVCLSAFGRSDSFAVDPKHYASNFYVTYQAFATETNPAYQDKAKRPAGRRSRVKVFAE